jgi:hypothetical protein
MTRLDGGAYDPRCPDVLAGNPVVAAELQGVISAWLRGAGPGPSPSV